jgi:hypothetical protein
MTRDNWTDREKKIAHRLFDAAVKKELAEILASFKSRADSAATPDDMWEIGRSLVSIQREFDKKYDFRYSQLEFVFARLLAEGRISASELAGLQDARIESIQRMAGYLSS